MTNIKHKKVIAHSNWLKKPTSKHIIPRKINITPKVDRNVLFCEFLVIKEKKIVCFIHNMTPMATKIIAMIDSKVMII